MKIQTKPKAKPKDKHTRGRYRAASAGQALFSLAVLIAVIALATLLLTVINQTFGYTIVVDKISPATLSSTPLEELSPAALEAILRGNLNRNRIRAIERELALNERSRGDLYQLIIDNIVEPRVVKSYNLSSSLLGRDGIQSEAAANYPQGRVVFRSWINAQFLTEPMSPQPEQAGVRPALFGSLLLIAIIIVFAFPIGAGAAIYLEEYANQNSRINRLIQINIENLAGVPSIVYGMLGLAIFVRALGPLTSGAAFGSGEANGRTIISAGLTLGLLILPVIIINAQEAIRAVPRTLREASYGLGATKWQTIWSHVLPQAMPGILTGSILAVSRAIGETAPLIVIGASTMITRDPTGLFSKFTALPIQIYNWTTRPQEEFRHIAAAAILVLLITLLSLNAFAIILRNRFSRRAS